MLNRYIIVKILNLILKDLNIIQHYWFSKTIGSVCKDWRYNILIKLDHYLKTYISTHTLARYLSSVGSRVSGNGENLQFNKFSYQELTLFHFQHFSDGLIESSNRDSIESIRIEISNNNTNVINQLQKLGDQTKESLKYLSILTNRDKDNSNFIVDIGKLIESLDGCKSLQSFRCDGKLERIEMFNQLPNLKVLDLTPQPTPNIGEIVLNIIKYCKFIQSLTVSTSLILNQNEILQALETNQSITKMDITSPMSIYFIDLINLLNKNSILEDLHISRFSNYSKSVQYPRIRNNSLKRFTSTSVQFFPLLYLWDTPSSIIYIGKYMDVTFTKSLLDLHPNLQSLQLTFQMDNEDTSALFETIKLNQYPNLKTLSLILEDHNPSLMTSFYHNQYITTLEINNLTYSEVLTLFLSNHPSLTSFQISSSQIKINDIDTLSQITSAITQNTTLNSITIIKDWFSKAFDFESYIRQFIIPILSTKKNLFKFRCDYCNSSYRHETETTKSLLFELDNIISHSNIRYLSYQIYNIHNSFDELLEKRLVVL
ncbi:hypothetical protein DLAC_09112 [Tieghemostelium lacteum]|uniref:Uncharacterized protein n=1 Tax=Tieghemostelium lacteum TaxID=361077 RepID=A0A151Z977_TIELA|nr:hypothetical protein DLAC_09112 [Tieghemostelium lacteum]|eukprot:KYQ90486.1 hypothetical protein DLAC_09112 [Tieghemostelium lacteum]